MTTSTTETQDARTAWHRFADNHPEFIGLDLPLLRERRDNCLTAIANMARPSQRDRVRVLLRNRSLAVIYAYDAVRKLRLLDQHTPASIRHLASQFDPFAPINEPFDRFRTQGRSNARLVCNFGPIRRMHQLFVADVIRALHPPRDPQFLFRGGMPSALSAVEAARTNGCTHAVEVDFIDFYGSVRNRASVAELLRPLPPAVTENVVCTSQHCRETDGAGSSVSSHEGDPSLNGSSGLALGAATSPIVGERIIGHLLSTVPSGHLVNYADNLLVLGRGEEEVMARAEHLRGVIERSDVGPLRLRIGRVAPFGDDPFDTVEFTKQVAVVDHDGLSWEPNEQKKNEHRIADEHPFRRRATQEELDRAERQLSNWRRSYRFWRRGDEWQIERLAEIATLRYCLHGTPINQTRAKTALIAAYRTAQGAADLRDFVPDIADDNAGRRRTRLIEETARLLNIHPVREAAE